MAKNHPIPTISHSVNGYSRYDIPESVVFSATAGILYPARVDFLNARDCRYIQAGGVIRTNPSVVPTFSPFRVRLHRYFCPISLYHPEMRVNSAGFDVKNMTTNVIHNAPLRIPGGTSSAHAIIPEISYRSGRSLVAFLGLSCGNLQEGLPAGFLQPTGDRDLTGVPVLGSQWVNADPILCYYDIIRCYYSFSQLGDWSFAIPNCATTADAFNKGLILPRRGASAAEPIEAQSRVATNFSNDDTNGHWLQYTGYLSGLDNFYETAFYPVKGSTSTYYDRTGELYSMIIECVDGSNNPTYTGAEVLNTYVNSSVLNAPGASARFSLYSIVSGRLPFGVAPSMADRFSRTLDMHTGADVFITNVSTVRQLAIAAKSQAYADLLAAGGSRFTDWIKTFFAANVTHVDRPVLVYSSSFYLNSSPIFNQSGTGELGSYAGTVEGQGSFGKQQRYCFDEPGYLIDLFSIQPLYHWSGIQRDYARYDKMDYFNPIFNEVGYQTLPFSNFGIFDETGNDVACKEPCYNEFRASFDRVVGDMAIIPGLTSAQQPNAILPLWVQQRAAAYNSRVTNFGRYARSMRFVDIERSNACFASNNEDNFFVNLYYNVSSKSLVAKNFATNLSVR